MHSRWVRLGQAFALSALSLAGCSDGPSGSSAPAAPASCPTVSSCGGDVAGTWQIDSECIVMNPPFVEPECHDVVRRTTVHASGSVTYSPGDDPASGTQELHLRYTLAITEVYSAACLQAIGSGAASPASCNGLQLYFAGPYSVTCMQAGDTCECQFADQNTIDQVDDYTIANQELVLASSGPVDYCRTGGGLVEAAVSASSTSYLTLHLGTPEGG